MSKTKVCHIITKMVYGGASLGTLHLVENLNPQHFEGTVICGIQSDDEGGLLQNNKDRKFSIIRIPEMVREINPIKDLVTLLKLVTYIKRNQYHIVHTHGSKAGVIGRLAAALCRTPVILHTVHGWGLKMGDFTTRIIFRLIEKWVASFTTRLLFQTKSDMEEAAYYQIGTKRHYALIGNGIELNAFFDYNKERAEEIKNDLKLTGKKVVGTVGRVSAQKNPRGFVEIARKVLEKRQDITFIFAGGGESLQEAKCLVRELNLGDYIIFTGVRDDIPELVANFDIFILPSLWEGMPRSLIEAMALAKPVIVYDIGGIREVVSDDVNGLIVPLNRTDEFARRIIVLLEDANYRNRLGKQARITSENFDFSRVATRTQGMYEALIMKSSYE